MLVSFKRACYTKALAEELQGKNSKQITDIVNEMNSKYNERAELMQDTAKTMADIQEEFSKRLNDIAEEMERVITEDMNMDEEAANAARETVRAYIDQINSMKDETHSAFAGLAAGAELLNGITKDQERKEQNEAWETHLKLTNRSQSKYPVFTNTTANENPFDKKESVATTPVNVLNKEQDNPIVDEGYATGTLSASPGFALVGEEGPELVKFDGGERVFPADKTSRILNTAVELSEQNVIKINAPNIDVPEFSPIKTSTPDYTFANITDDKHTPINTSAPDNIGISRDEQNSRMSPEEKKITLDINGSGEFTVDGSVDEETVWGIMSSNLKPLLMKMLKQEIFEEGDRAYVF